VCTLSFRLEPDGFELWFSRDERRSRAPANPPSVSRVGDSRVLAPRDPEGGGTWLAVNARGLALALLNDYASPGRGARFESRGRLVLELCGARDAREVEARLGARSLERYRPFELAVLVPGGPVTRFAWDGRELAAERGARGPFASSAVAHAEARAARRARFAELGTGALERFHREHAPARGPLSACMHRADAKTVSLARVRVTRERVAMAYAPGSPCRTRFGAALELARD
jgi:Transport and Golgi organisation 2